MSDIADMIRQAAQAAGPNAGPSVNSIFDEEPVSLRVFVQDKRFLGNPPLSEVQYEAVRHIERVYYPATYELLSREFDSHKQPGTFHAGAVSSWRNERYWSEPCRMCNFITLQWGKGSGKDHICRVASLRIAYLLICLASPQQYYGMPPQDTIHLLNVASSSAQAQQAFFMPITRVVRDSGGVGVQKWFADKADARQNVISFRKNVEAVSGHSDAESQEGLNLMLAIADEIDAFRSKKEMAVRKNANSREPTKSAEGILSMMRTSGATRFPEVFKNVRISYPRFLGSTIQRLTEAAHQDVELNGIDSRHYVSGPKATWEVNPRVKGKEDFAGDYREDPIMARARYECKPARAINPYFRNHQAVDASFINVDRPPLHIDYALESSHGRESWVPRYTFAPDFIPIRGAIYSMHADMAITGDRAGIAMAHVVSYKEYESIAEDADGARHPIRELRPHVKVDFITSYSANPSVVPARDIQIRWARQLCIELIRMGFNVRRMTFDAFQSSDSMQILNTHGIASERVSSDTSEDPWTNLKDLISEGRVIIPRPPAPDGRMLLRDELLSLTRLPNGKIDHPSDGSKDEADALACAILGAVKIGGQEESEGARAYHGATGFTIGSVFDLPFGPAPSTVFNGLSRDTSRGRLPAGF